ncbi:MAG: transcriptional regulator BetI [Pseudomonadota bacterium]
MPKVGMEPIRKAALVKAAIAEVAGAGSLEVTMAQVARSAGVSAPLAHHYFGGKSALFEAAMRTILRDYAQVVRAELRTARTPRQRVEAVLRGSLNEAHFTPEVIAAWLVFYVQAQRTPSFRRLLRVYHRRLRSNLLAGLRPLMGAEADAAADGLAAMIDGQYLHTALADRPRSGAEAARAVQTYFALLLDGRPS